jgi:hypothetical protein
VLHAVGEQVSHRHLAVTVRHLDPTERVSQHPVLRLRVDPRLDVDPPAPGDHDNEAPGGGPIGTAVLADSLLPRGTHAVRSSLSCRSDEVYS